MASDIGLRDFISRTAFYHTQHKLLQQPLLQRNLRHVLDRHEQEHRRLLDSDATTGHRQMIATPQNGRVPWQLPSDQRLWEHVMAGRKPVLCIQSLLLKHRRSSTKCLETVLRRSQPNDGPSWLPHPGDWTMDLQITISILHKSSNAPVHVDQRAAKILKHVIGDDESAFTIALPEPFLVPAEKLLVNQEVTKRDASRSWKRLVAEHYTLDIRIVPNDSRDAAELLSQLEGRPLQTYQDMPKNEGVIKAVWGDSNAQGMTSTGLPDVPPDDHYLSLTHRKGPISLKLDYGVDVRMGWNRPEETPLSAYNHSLQGVNPGATQMPTPSESDQSDMAMTREQSSRITSVKYLFRSTNFMKRFVEVETLKCIFCPRLHEQPSYDRLHLHYVTHHDHFRFEAEDDDRDPNVMVVSLYIREEERTMVEEDWDWVAPVKPFDVRAHRRGRSGWTVSRTQDDRQAGIKKAIPPKGKVRQPKKSIAALPPPIHIERRRKDMPPEDVQDLPPRERRKHKVPFVEGVTFYRTTSKQPLQPGEEVSDSDDDIDNTWLVQSQRRDLRALVASEVELEFHELLNRHLDEEDPMSDLLVRDAMVRFTRKHSTKLGTSPWRPIFERKLEQLRKTHIIKQNDVDYCLGLLPDIAADTEDVEMEDADTRHAEARKTEMGNVSTGRTEAEDAASGAEHGLDPSEAGSQEKMTPRITGLFARAQTRVGSMTKSQHDGIDSRGNTPAGSSRSESANHTPSSKVRYRWKLGGMFPIEEDQSAKERQQG